MKIEKLIPDFWKTKLHIQTAVLGASGWDAKVFDPKMVAGPQVFLYLYDQPTKFVWMVSTSIEMFQKISIAAHSDTKITQDIRDCLGTAIAAMAAGKKTETIDRFDNEHQAAWLLASYAGTTSTWLQADQMKQGGHFIVLNYRPSAASPDARLRPFVFNGAAGSALPVEDFMGLVERVMEMDRGKHPGWFA